MLEMACNFEEGSIATLIIHCGSLVSIIIGLLCVLTNTSIERSLRGILISYSIANVIGSGFFTYDILTYPFQDEDLYANFMYQVTMLMSLAHLLLLILHYHIILTSNRKKKGRDFVGLILTAWIAAATLGCVNASLDDNVRGIVVIFIFVVVLMITCRAYFVVLKQHMKKESIRISYIETFLYTEEGTNDLQKANGQWNLRFLAIILISFATSSIPWLVMNVSGFHKDREDFEHSIPLSVYSLSYYVPSVICMYMKYKDFNTEEAKGCSCLEEAYRLRNYSRQHSSSCTLGKSNESSKSAEQTTYIRSVVNNAYI